MLKSVSFHRVMIYTSTIATSQLFILSDTTPPKAVLKEKETPGLVLSTEEPALKDGEGIPERRSAALPPIAVEEPALRAFEGVRVRHRYTLPLYGSVSW